MKSTKIPYQYLHLSDDEIIQVFKLRNQFMKILDIADRMSLPSGIVSEILKGKRYEETIAKYNLKVNFTGQARKPKMIQK